MSRRLTKDNKMAALYTYPEETGRARFGSAAWTGAHGTKTLDWAWDRAQEDADIHSDFDTAYWVERENELPKELRDELFAMYQDALKLMRAYLEATT